MTVNAVVSGSVILICLGLALIMWTVGNKHWPYVILSLVAVGFGGLMATKVGSVVRTAMARVGAFTAVIGGKIGVPVVLSAIAVLLVVYLVYKLRSKKIDVRAVAATGGVAVLSGAVPGAVGATLAYTIGGLAWLASWLIGLLFGIH